MQISIRDSKYHSCALNKRRLKVLAFYQEMRAPIKDCLLYFLYPDRLRRGKRW